MYIWNIRSLPWANAMEMYSWQIKHSTINKIFRLVWKSNVYYPSQKSPTIHTIQSHYTHSYLFLTDNFNVGRSTSNSRFWSISLKTSLLKCYTPVCRPSPFSILSRCFKQATLNLTLTFSTGLTAPLTCYTNQLMAWKCCSCATHLIYKNWKRNLRLT
jgi:hypothetical protein